MFPSIRNLLAKFKVQGGAQLGSDEELKSLCRAAGLKWRERILTPIVTLRVFFLQILHGNVAMNTLPHIAGFSFTDTAYCTARIRLPLAVLQQLLSSITQKLLQVRPVAQADRWRGHRVLITDASGFTLPDTPELQEHFGQVPNQKPGCGFPVAFGLFLMHYGSGVFERLVVGPLKTSELALAPPAHEALLPEDVVVGDSAFGNYVELALLWQRGVYAVCRLARRNVDFTPGRPHARGKHRRGQPTSRWVCRLGERDQIVEWLKPQTPSHYLAAEAWAALPAVLRVRELRYRVCRPGFRPFEVTLATTLLDPHRYPPEALAELYHQRWTIETNLRHLKQTLHMDTLHAKTVEGVLKEMVMFCLLYNLVRLVMGAAAHAQHVKIDQISFRDALCYLLYEPDATELHPLLIHPRRPDRLEPRVLKRRPKRYSLLTRPRAELRKALLLKTLLPK